MKSLTPQELRLNNLVLIDGETRQISGIIGVLIYAHHTDAHKVLNTPDAVFGIPLNEEWLLKFGFQKLHHFGNYEYTLLINKSPHYREFWSIEVVHRKEENKFLTRLVIEPDTIDDAGSVNYLDTDIQYVHQLQNLYFSLMGQELNP